MKSNYLATNLIVMLMAGTALSLAHPVQAQTTSNMRFIQIAAKDKFQRSAIADLGVSIEGVRTDSVWGFANARSIKSLKESGFKILGDFDYQVGRGGHESDTAFPPEDSKFHDYVQVESTLKQLAAKNADIAKVSSIGKTLEGREMWAIRLPIRPKPVMGTTM